MKRKCESFGDLQNKILKKDSWENKDFVLKAVKTDGSSLKYASEELKNDKNIVLEAVIDYSHALEYASLI